MRHSPTQRGFTLVELSIVLVIIGLLAGGISVGRDMVVRAEVNRIMRDMESHATAIGLFRAQYRALPGDFNDALRYWGDNAALCADASITNGTYGACNGNGNGFVEQTSSLREDLYAWLQLGSSGLIPGQYNYNSGYNETQYRGFTYPPTERSGALSFKYYGTSIAGTAQTYGPINGNSGHYIKAGIGSSSTGNLATAILRPQEAAGLDKRVDDGLPNSGALLATGTSASNCVTSSTSYTTRGSGLACMIYLSTDRK